ncbi:hypothetical protein [Paracoccus sp. PAR01]|uniref:hypothetical protein n=1 Tax=Paracoccus sp. PAR01 TaxID=2769282 RepID=UPI001783D9AC|nr:hypothetical protein [Paracoccus sp. PAR01]MBD9527836.1 hypothetical protein [Paracoccus sp. PAR01]
MAPRVTPKAPKPEPVETLPDPVPEELRGLDARWHRTHQSFLAEVIALRTRATSVDRSLIISAVRALAGEQRARDLADRAAGSADGDVFLALTRLAQSEGRAARSALANLGLSGDRRGVGAVRRAGAAALDGETIAHVGKSRWAGVI